MSTETEDPVQRVIDQATDYLQSLSLDDIVGARLQYIADYEASDEFTNSDLEAMDLAIQNLLKRDKEKYRQIAHRFLGEDRSALRDTAARMLLQMISLDGDRQAVEVLCTALTSGSYERDAAFQLIDDNVNEVQRGFVMVMMAVSVHFVARDLHHI